MGLAPQARKSKFTFIVVSILPYMPVTEDQHTVTGRVLGPDRDGGVPQNLRQRGDGRSRAQAVLSVSLT